MPEVDVQVSNEDSFRLSGHARGTPHLFVVLKTKESRYRVSNHFCDYSGRRLPFTHLDPLSKLIHLPGFENATHSVLLRQPGVL